MRRAGGEMRVALTHVDKPLDIGPVRLKNRVWRSAPVPGMATGGVTPSFIDYHEARARGGVALSILEILSVHPTSPAGLNAWVPGVEDGYGPLVERCGAHGMKLFQQLWQVGVGGIPV